MPSYQPIPTPFPFLAQPKHLIRQFVVSNFFGLILIRQHWVFNNTLPSSISSLSQTSTINSIITNFTLTIILAYLLDSTYQLLFFTLLFWIAYFLLIKNISFQHLILIQQLLVQYSSGNSSMLALQTELWFIMEFLKIEKMIQKGYQCQINTNLIKQLEHQHQQTQPQPSTQTILVSQKDINIILDHFSILMHQIQFIYQKSSQNTSFYKSLTHSSKIKCIFTFTNIFEINQYFIKCLQEIQVLSSTFRYIFINPFLKDIDALIFIRHFNVLLNTLQSLSRKVKLIHKSIYEQLQQSQQQLPIQMREIYDFLVKGEYDEATKDKVMKVVQKYEQNVNKRQINSRGSNKTSIKIQLNSQFQTNCDENEQKTIESEMNHEEKKTLKRNKMEFLIKLDKLLMKGLESRKQVQRDKVSIELDVIQNDKAKID